MNEPKPTISPLGRRDVVALLALLPAAAMLRNVWRGSDMQYQDYWLMHDRLTEGGALLDLGALFTLNNEHPVVVPQLLYRLGALVADGSNRWLGTLVVLIAAGQVVALWFVVQRQSHRTPTSFVPALFAVSASAFLFSRHGVWNFMASMSGTAWLTANLLVVLAITLTATERDRAALVCGVGASLSYATGLMVWPALLIGRIVRERRLIVDPWLIALATATYAWYFLLADAVNSQSGPGEFQPIESLNSAAVFGAAAVEPVILRGAPIGFLGLYGGAFIMGHLIWRRRAAAAPWVALYLYASLSLVLMSYGRGGAAFLAEYSPSRFTSLSSLLWISILGGLVLLIDDGRLSTGLCILAIILAARVGGAEVENQRALARVYDDVAVAFYFGAYDDQAISRGSAATPWPDFGDRLAEQGHYPHSSGWTADCGLLGTDATGPADLDAIASAVDGRANGGDTIRLTASPGEAALDGADCVVILDENGKVVGAGVLGLTDGNRISTQRLDPDAVTAIAPRESATYQLALVRDGVVTPVGDPQRDESLDRSNPTETEDP